MVKVDNTKNTESIAKGFYSEGMSILRALIQIMPAWSGQMQRSIFVSAKAPRGTPQTVKAEATALKEPERKMTFDMWRIQVDMKFTASGRSATDELTDKGLVALKKDYDTGVSPSDYAEAYMLRDV